MDPTHGIVAFTYRYTVQVKLYSFISSNIGQFTVTIIIFVASGETGEGAQDKRREYSCTPCSNVERQLSVVCRASQNIGLWGWLYNDSLGTPISQRYLGANERTKRKQLIRVRVDPKEQGVRVTGGLEEWGVERGCPLSHWAGVGYGEYTPYLGKFFLNFQLKMQR